jgi:hypothetical protein
VHLYLPTHYVIPQRLDQRCCCFVPAGLVLSYLYAQHIAPYVRFFFLLAAMLSTRFGYGRPAAAALRLALALCAFDNGLLFFLGFLRSQTGFVFFFAIIRHPVVYSPLRI